MKNRNSHLDALMDNKKEYTDHLFDLLSDPMIATFQDIYQKCLDAPETRKKGILTSFQDALAQIPYWNNTIIYEQYNKVVTHTGCKYIPDLVKALVSVQVKISLIANSSGAIASNIKVRVPNAENFLHRCYVDVARAVWKRPYLLYHQGRSIEKQHNLLELEKLIQSAIRTTLRGYVPMDQLIAHTQPTDILLEEDGSSESEDEESEVDSSSESEDDESSESEYETTETEEDNDEDVEIVEIRELENEEVESPPVTPSNEIDQHPQLVDIDIKEVDGPEEMGLGEFTLEEPEHHTTEPESDGDVEVDNIYEETKEDNTSVALEQNEAVENFEENKGDGEMENVATFAPLKNSDFVQTEELGAGSAVPENNFEKEEENVATSVPLKHLDIDETEELGADHDVCVNKEPAVASPRPLPMQETQPSVTDRSAPYNFMLLNKRILVKPSKLKETSSLHHHKKKKDAFF